jgi:hypothetical protein
MIEKGLILDDWPPTHKILTGCQGKAWGHGLKGPAHPDLGNADHVVQAGL